jgi:hypothetical protein
LHAPNAAQSYSKVCPRKQLSIFVPLQLSLPETHALLAQAAATPSSAVATPGWQEPGPVSRAQSTVSVTPAGHPVAIPPWHVTCADGVHGAPWSATQAAPAGPLAHFCAP